MMRFTEDELAIAKSVDLCQVAASLGYTVQRIGKYHTLKEMDSIRIYDRTNWYRWSRSSEKGNNGGSQIDFLRVFEGMSIKEAVFWLLDFAGYHKLNNGEYENRLTDRTRIIAEKKVTERKPFILPERASDNSRLISYLTDERCISKGTVQLFLDQDLIYESAQHHNVVFLGKDPYGKVRFASMRGTYDKDGRSFKCDVAGNDKRYGFHLESPGSNTIAVFEAAIDLMSYMDIFPNTDEHLLALGMVADNPLNQYLSDHPEIKGIRLCLDNDEPGRKASIALAEKYLHRNYTVRIAGPPDGYKDYNAKIVRVNVPYRIRRAKLSGIQRRYFARLYRTGKLKKRPYSQAWKYRDEIKKMHQLHDEYMLLSKYEIHKEEDIEALCKQLDLEKKTVEKERRALSKEKAFYRGLFQKVERIEELSFAESAYVSGDTFFEDEHREYRKITGEIQNSGYSVDELKELIKEFKDRSARISEDYKSVGREYKIALRLRENTAYYKRTKDRSKEAVITGDRKSPRGR